MFNHNLQCCPKICCCPCGCRGPVGPAGPQGTGTTIKGNATSKEQLDIDHPYGPPEDAYLIDGVLYIWNENQGWHPVGNLQGPQGTGTTIKGNATSKEQLDIDHPDGPPEDAYLIDGVLYIWNENQGWHPVGDVKGPAGPTTLQFASITSGRVQSGTGGERSGNCLIGLGQQRIVANTDPLIVDISALALKVIDKATITDIVYSLSLAVPQTDITSTVYAQLYIAPTLLAREFTPIPETRIELEVPNGAGAGTVFTRHLTDLKLEIPANSLLLLGFYSTSHTFTAGVEAFMGGIVRLV